MDRLQDFCTVYDPNNPAALRCRKTAQVRRFPETANKYWQCFNCAKGQGIQTVNHPSDRYCPRCNTEYKRDTAEGGFEWGICVTCAGNQSTYRITNISADRCEGCNTQMIRSIYYMYCKWNWWPLSDYRQHPPRGTTYWLCPEPRCHHLNEPQSEDCPGSEEYRKTVGGVFCGHLRDNGIALVYKQGYHIEYPALWPRPIAPKSFKNLHPSQWKSDGL